MVLHRLHTHREHTKHANDVRTRRSKHRSPSKTGLRNGQWSIPAPRKELSIIFRCTVAVFSLLRAAGTLVELELKRELNSQHASGPYFIVKSVVQDRLSGHVPRRRHEPSGWGFGWPLSKTTKYWNIC